MRTRDREWLTEVVNRRGTFNIVRRKIPNGTTYEPRYIIGAADIRHLHRIQKVLGAGVITTSENKKYANRLQSIYWASAGATSRLIESIDTQRMDNHRRKQVGLIKQLINITPRQGAQCEKICVALSNLNNNKRRFP